MKDVLFVIEEDYIPSITKANVNCKINITENGD